MSRVILLMTVLCSAQAFADTYEANFENQIAELTKKTSEITKDIKAQELGIEDLETMRQVIES
ncbi:MAG: hypothetical protein COW01_09470 [Bdellovibrionales bacterium CG12_big_fil_rev_8_21_14_0_65_38_15]|nr:MAG: hypothetical protein COW79_09475 [Bdellovibrionales bacterium CG22_combo_CG10-13_8_21_14_all_38_13]PIQ54756.1 MAG: hypothetical protein COW01_09470 [Bdellovibrionales bacterium CG12_big_fil_rev_8_21_14_0_65_38_15]PIR31311.1 MAG: hypothetical protein COV38_01085 [Bdellovibrionales bacterium CG11_big_fil_rev_8_21_14_0_20_38_13]